MLRIFQECPEHLDLEESKNGPYSPVISLHALKDTQRHLTIRLATQIEQVEVIMLVDSGSTHNFIDSKLAKKLYLPIEPVGKMRVITVNRGSLFAQVICKAVTWKLKVVNSSLVYWCYQLRGVIWS